MSNLELLPTVEHIVYVSSKYHALLADDAWKPGGPNIGTGGSNLTICILSLDRTALTERLVRSIGVHLPTFAGEVIILDDGSAPDRLARLRSICAEQPFRCRIIEFGRNHGAAASRNQAVTYAETEWIMSLDDDVYFVSNPLPSIQSDLARLGCHFINVSLQNRHARALCVQHGHLFLTTENGDVSICYGRLPKRPSEAPTREAHLCTFLFGGACIFKRATFEAIGGYDEALCLGIDDIDLSLRVFQHGYKLGMAGAIALVHDTTSETGQEEHDIRAVTETVVASASYFERKHGISLNADILRRIAARSSPDLVPRSPSGKDKTVCPGHVDSRPTITLVIDTDGWAFSNIACQLQRYLSDRFNFTIIPMGIVGNVVQVVLMCPDSHLVHFFWREDVRLLGSPHYRKYVEQLGLTYDQFADRILRSKKITTSIYDHLFLAPEELSARLPIYREILAAYSVASIKLRDIYSNAPGYPPPTATLEDGVDLTLFHPFNSARFESIPTRELVVGWAGNSKWSAEKEDFKGVHTILLPALEELRAEGLPVRACLADRQEKWVPHHDMPSYYSQIDVYVCTSKIEGTPNPVLEAMACGVPVISTDVGIVRQAFGPLQQKFILSERSIAALKIALRRLHNNPASFRALSQENLCSIRDWDWSNKATKFGRFFDDALSGLGHR